LAVKGSPEHTSGFLVLTSRISLSYWLTFAGRESDMIKIALMNTKY